jgi:hypothetical protein
VGALLRFNVKRLVGVAITLVVIASLTTFAQSRAGQSELKRLGIVGPRTAFTELAFVDPLKLPSTLHRAPQLVPIPFTITNHATRPASYRWQIAIAGTRQRILGSGSAFVEGERAVTIVTRVELGCSTRTRVNVVLSSGESIGFWATCVGRSREPTGHGRR